ncbi:MAG: hypothetical protein ACI9DH_000569 [Halioglobus sp.]|jgi:hypothetical protein
MALDPLTAAFEVGKMAIERIWPDATERGKQLLKLEEVRQSGNLAALNAHVTLMTGQISVNAKSAGHKSIFVAGARPAAIWMGVIGMGYAAIIHPLLTWAWSLAAALGHIPTDVAPPPMLESAALTALVTTLLGAGSWRSYDKKSGVETNSLGRQS